MIGAYFFPRTVVRVFPDFPNVLRVLSLCIDECVRVADCSAALEHLCSELLVLFSAFSVGSLVLLCCISPHVIAFSFSNSLFNVSAIARTLSMERYSAARTLAARFELDKAVAMRS